MIIKYLRHITLIIILLFQSILSWGQDNDISYDAVKEYTIANIAVTGDFTYENYIIIGFSGLSVGDKISVPGKEISSAIKRFWRQGYFSEIQIYADKIENDSVWLNIYLKQRSKINEIKFYGVKKSEQEDIEKKINIKRNDILTADLTDRIKVLSKNYFSEKGFDNAEITVIQKPDAEKGLANLDIIVDKKQKIKVHDIIVSGNNSLSITKIDNAMKKTNRPTLLNFFKSKKFIKSLYETDKNSLIEKYNEIGHRDARILKDSVVYIDSTHVDIYLTVDEGKKYYFGNMSWSGNTVYTTDVLDAYLNIKKGDVFNQKQLDKRLNGDEDAVMSLYKDNGYLFSQVDPIESSIVGDSINFEFHLYEGKPATINNVIIKGNDRVYEHVIRREVRTRPGDIYSQNNLIRSLRDLAQLQLFNEEKLYRSDLIQPDIESGTVDIAYNLETKSSDQFEFSAGISPQGPILSVGVKFTNFAIQNLFRPSMYRIVPQGEGQTLNIKAQASGQYYQNYSISFIEPWLGGRRPNSLSAAIFYAVQTGLSERYQNAINSNLSQYYAYNNGMGRSGYTYEYDSSTRMLTLGASLGIGTRLKWPDDYFSLYTELSYQHYRLRNWYDYYFGFKNGISNNLALGITLQRNSIDNPIYTRKGSILTLSVSATPPYSAFSGADYSKLSAEDTRRWIEYHKWKLSFKNFTPLSRNEKLVLMTRVEYGFVGYYNKYKRSPFEKFHVGGDGMSGYTSPGTEIIGMRGYASGSLTPIDPTTRTSNGNIYTRMTMELRYPILMQQTTVVWALAFVEGGNCWSDFKYFNPFNIKRAAGVGVRVFLPMFGMLGIDWGYGFDLPYGSTTRSGSQFTFVLGQEF